MNKEDNDKILDLLCMLVDENKELQQRIDKAIRILETLKSSARWERHLFEVYVLLDILRGEDVSNKDIEYQIYKKELDRELKKVNSIEEFLRGEDNE